MPICPERNAMRKGMGVVSEVVTHSLQGVLEEELAHSLEGVPEEELVQGKPAVTLTRNQDRKDGAVPSVPTK